MLLTNQLSIAQLVRYTASNAHAHNDYEQKNPFWQAYENGFGSIEADIFLTDSALLVAHTPAELKVRKRRLDSLYLLPLMLCLQKNKGSVYADKKKKLQLMIDIKTAAVPTLERLIETLKRYPLMLKTPTLQISISGSRPPATSFTTYPPFIGFDGELKQLYPAEALTRIAMLSAPLKDYTQWNGLQPLAGEDLQRVKQAVEKAHKLGKPVRFWDAPDHPEAWKILKDLGVDFINTDHIDELASFLNGAK